MAIDDNTVYGLTGAQVKELPEKIDAVKGIPKELTTDDYNWPTDNPDGVGLWLLEPGVYNWKTGVKVYKSATPSVTSFNRFAIVEDSLTSGVKQITDSRGSTSSTVQGEVTLGGSAMTVNATTGRQEKAWNTLITGAVIYVLGDGSGVDHYPLSSSAGAVLNNFFISMPLTDSDFNTLWEEA